MNRRIIEMIGSALLGGGLVAAGYELVRSPSSGASRPEAAPMVESEDGGEPSQADTGGEAPAQDRAAWLTSDGSGNYAVFPPVFRAPSTFDADAESEFTRHAVVTSLAVIVRAKADVASPLSGVVRSGTRLRVAAEPVFGGGCKGGWYAIFPEGFVCKDAGVSVGDEPPTDGILEVPQPRLDAALPYEYWRVKDLMTPFFHRLPTYTEQDRADGAGRAWYAENGTKPMPSRPADRPPEVPAVVKEYANAGYYVTKAGEEQRLKRHFLRTIRGLYARKYQFHQRPFPKFRGVLVGPGAELPLYFIRREVSYEQRESEESSMISKTGDIPERLSRVEFARKINIGNKEYYQSEDGKLMRSYAVSRVAKIKRPVGLASDEKWVHVDLSEQSLVAYDGDTPVFATLVSTGKEDGMTPVGVFRVQTKHIAAPMRDQPVEEEAYSIEDVPWTQYFSGNIALHGAFWHAGFGLVRSHGCVNLSPADARWVFGFTEPAVPDGWHSVTSSTLSAPEGTAVVVTE